MDLFGVVRVFKPTQVTVGVRPLRDGEESVLQATAGRAMVIAPKEGSEDVPSVFLEAQPIWSIPSPAPQVPVVELSETSSSKSAETPKTVNELESASQGTKHKQTDVDAGIRGEALLFLMSSPPQKKTRHALIMLMILLLPSKSLNFIVLEILIVMRVFVTE